MKAIGTFIGAVLWGALWSGAQESPAGEVQIPPPPVSQQPQGAGRPGCWGYSEFPTEPIQPAAPLPQPAAADCVSDTTVDVPLPDGTLGKLRATIYRQAGGLLFITEDVTPCAPASFFISDISFGTSRAADGFMRIVIGPSYNSLFIPQQTERRGIGRFFLPEEKIHSYHPNSIAVIFDFRVCDAEDRELTTFSAEVAVPPLLAAASATSEQVPTEVKQDILQAFIKDGAESEEFSTDAGLCEWERCGGGHISHKLSGSATTQGGWVVKFEVDLLGDEQPEQAWLVVPPLVGDRDYYRTLFVYDAQGRFLFPAPIHILRSSRGQGAAASGQCGSRTTSTRPYDCHTRIGGDAWSLTSEGVTLLSRDVCDEIHPDTQATARPGAVVEIRRTYTRQGIRTEQRSIPPDSPDYAEARAAAEAMAAHGTPRPARCITHVVSLAELATAERPTWHTTRADLISALSNSATEHENTLPPH